MSLDETKKRATGAAGKLHRLEAAARARLDGFEKLANDKLAELRPRREGLRREIEGASGSERAELEAEYEKLAAEITLYENSLGEIDRQRKALS